MKRTLAFTVTLFLGSFAGIAIGQSAPAERFERGARFENRLLDEVAKMTRAELPDATIMAYVRSRRARLDDDVTPDDLIRLRRVGVSEKVVTFIASLTGIGYHSTDRAEDRDQDWDRDRDVAYESDGTSVVAIDPAYADGYADPYGWSSVYDPYPWWGDPYPYWYAYSPFFFGGGVSFRGGGRFHGGRRDGHGGHTGGGRHGGGGHRGSHGDTSHSGASHSGSSRGGGSHSGSSHSGGGHGGGHGRH